jgi:hypothetical protein
LEDKEPEEAFTVVKPKVTHFHIFGCLVYNHVSVEKRTKFELSRWKGLFVGYTKTSKDCMVWILEKSKIVVSMDVKSEEKFASRKSREPTPVVEDEEQEDLKVDVGSLVISRKTQQPSSE